MNFTHQNASFFVSILSVLLLKEGLAKHFSQGLPTAAAAGEYCETEAFNASCGTGVVVMTNARYGRMKLSRCVKLDYGHVGCSADVMELADFRCSGLHECQIRIPDALFGRAKPCPDDLKPYLEASYTCIKDPLPTKVSCTGGRHRAVQLSRSRGHIASTAVEDRLCGRNSLVIELNGAAGQKVSINVVDFGLFERKKQRIQVCQVYAVIQEDMNTHIRNTTLCGGMSRSRHVYTSTSNKVKLLFSAKQIKAAARFLIHYEGVGCPDVTPPTNTWVVRSGQNIMIGCNHTKQLWKITCRNGKWEGIVGNCTSGKPNTLLEIKVNDFSLPYGVSVVVIILVALMIGVGVLFAGLVCLKRQRDGLCMTDSSELDFSDVHVIASRDELREEDKYGTVRYVRGDTPLIPPCTPLLPPCTPLLDKGAKSTIYGQLRRHPACSACKDCSSTLCSAASNGRDTTGGGGGGNAANSPRHPLNAARLPAQDLPQYFVLDPEQVLAARLRGQDDLVHWERCSQTQTAVRMDGEGGAATVSVISCPDCGLKRSREAGDDNQCNEQTEDALGEEKQPETTS